MNRSPAWMIAFILVIQIASFSFEEAPTIIEFDEPSYEDTSSAYGRNNSSGGNNSGGNNTGGNNTGGNNTGGNNTGGNNTGGNNTGGNNTGGNNTGGNNTGGNNTGGNNTGGNNTGGNNTGGNNTGGNNTGGNNSSNCGNDSNLTDLMVWTDATTYTVGDIVLGNFFVNCTVIGETYQLDYEVVEYNTNIEHADGEWNWTAQNNWESFNPTWTGLPVGDYCIHSTLVIWTGSAYSFVDFVSSCFDIMNSTTGGNNTGGNNTGGNNTGGNNTGGNNTGGNNTGGNNTGGNNTGGNNTGCPGLAPSGIDGVIDIVNVSTAYAQGDMVDAWVDLCWSPYLGNTSIWYTVWFNNSNGNTIQSWGLQGSTWFPTWEQGIDYGGGHWEFPIRHLPLSGAWNLSIDALTPGETYCFEGNLKVFDTSIGVFIWVDDATPMCFSTPQSNNTGNNTGGNNTGGNNTGGNNTGNNTGGNNTTANTAPQISSVVISPSSPLETDVLTCSYVFTDADNDPDESIFVWTVNGATVTSVSSVLTSGYVAGDFVTCAVLAYDGMDYGNMGTSTVLINSNATGSSNNSSGGGLPSIGIAGTLATIGLSFIAVTRRGRKD
ncbi:MAG: hypothetical protein HOE69_02975 [Euryarchaeota archaeon]|nr:hypothetical protein [Euryarchaeota archaeon]